MKVYIADNHKLIVEGMTALLTKHNIKVEGSFNNGLEVIKWREANDTDILILDISMPLLNGIDVLKHFKKKNIHQKTLIVSTYNDYNFINDSMKNGAGGYILKTECGILVDALETVYKGGKYLSESVTKVILNKNIETNDGVEKTETKVLLKDLINNVENVLSEKEKTILELLAKKYSSKEIQRELSITGSTFRTYTSRMREKFNINKEKIIIGTAGRVVPRKNFEHFVQLGIDVCKKYKKDCLFVLVGDTPYYFGQNLMTKLKAMVKNENLEDKFIFTGYTDKVEAYISDFDIFFIPSMYEDPFPRVVIESMALGKPVLGYNIGGIGEAIDNKVNGYSFNLDDSSVIDSILELIEDEELRLKMSFEARKKAVNSYDSRIIASKILGTLKLLFP